MTIRENKKGSLFKDFLLKRRTPLQIIEQIYIRFAENTRLYRVFSHQSDKGGISHIWGTCLVPHWRGVYVGILYE